MKTKMNIKSIIILATICLTSMFFINICLATNTGKITVDMARLREKPNTESKVLETISSTEEVEILEEVNDWYKVKYKGITGYIRKDLLQSENNQDTIQTNQTTSQETNTISNQTTSQETNTILNQTTETNTNQVNETSAISDEEEIVETNTTPEEKDIEKGKYKIVKDTKLKITPLISSIEIYELKKDQEVEVTEIINDWAKITTTDNNQGWLIKENLETIQNTQTTTQENQQQTETKQEQTSTEKTETTQTTENIPKVNNTTTEMYINTETANIRKEPNTTSNIIKQLPINTKVEVISTENGWCLIKIDGINGYISKSLLSTTKTETSRGSTTRNETTKNSENKTQSTTNTNKEQSTTNTTNTNNTTNSTNQTTKEETSTATTTGNAVVEYAKKYLGCKYVYGGTTTSGFDCSGFTQYVYKHFGITLNRTAAAQYSNGKSVTSLQAGDLVMFGKSGINHVGIYIGGNTFIHAANTSRGVTTDTLASGYYKTNYVGARRVL